MKTVKLTIAGYDFTCGKCIDEYYVAVSDIEKAFGYRADSGRKILKSAKLNAFADKASEKIQVGKSKIVYQNQRYSTVTLQTFFLLLDYEAHLGNQAVIPFLSALAKEAFERRINAALNIHKEESKYEAETRRFREVARACYLPQLTYWHHQDIESGSTKPYSVFVNQFKAAVGLPLTSIDEYSEDELRLWINKIPAYDALRKAGLTNKASLAILAI